MISANAIVRLHDELNRAWHAEPGPQVASRPGSEISDDPWLELVARHHRANFDLWHIEDEARAPGANDSALAEVKRRIDQVNQLRNDLAEQMDCALTALLSNQRLPNSGAPLHSESPGLMIDRMSILALKIYHTREEADRAEAPAGHPERNRERLAILEEQRNDLAACLDVLWSETISGLRRFKVYRQFKMYNDPDLNPAIYRAPRDNPGT